jgi:hypothetical protein
MLKNLCLLDTANFAFFQGWVVGAGSVKQMMYANNPYKDNAILAQAWLAGLNQAVDLCLLLNQPDRPKMEERSHCE